MEHNEHLEHTDAPQNMKKIIWNTFWILLGFTVIDIALYFVLLQTHALWKNLLFIALGIVKAYYIVQVFMHMKFERKFLRLMIVLPMLLVVYLVWLVLTEGDYTIFMRSL